MSKKQKNIFIIVVVLILSAGFLYFVGNFLLSRLFGNNGADGLGSLPCKPASQVELGYPSAGGPTAEFTTNGSDLYVNARYFPHGILNLGKQINVVDIGLAEITPIWDNNKSVAVNATKSVRFVEDNYGKISLPAGRYWLWSGAGDVVVYSCDSNGVSNPNPVR